VKKELIQEMSDNLTTTQLRSDILDMQTIIMQFAWFYPNEEIRGHIVDLINKACKFKVEDVSMATDIDNGYFRYRLTPDTIEKEILVSFKIRM